MTINLGPPEPESPPSSAAAGAFSPLPGSERVQLLDSLRGFALFGIVIVNMVGFKYPIFAYSLTDSPFPDLANTVAKDAILFFAAGNFISIFSLLFGLGLVMQQQRLQAAGCAFRPFIHRRMAVLLVFGILHGIFLWAGDILALYALFGFLSPALLKLGLRAILRLTGALALMLVVLWIYQASRFPAGLWESPDTLSFADEWIESYLYGDFRYLVQVRFHEWTGLWEQGLTNSHPYSFLFFLAGIGLGKADVVSKLAAWRGRMVRLATLILPFALSLNLLSLAYYSAWIRPTVVLHYLGSAGYLVGDALLTFVYLVAFVCFFQSGRAPALHSALAAVGRLSLSNYLFQSLVANVLFMYWGLGLYGRIPAHHGLLISMLIFILQVILSRIWLRHLSLGPAEWVWRKLCYPRAIPPLRATLPP